MPVEQLLLLMFGSILLMLVLGVPLAFGLGVIGLIFGLLVWGPNSFSMVVMKALAVDNYVYISIPLFIFTGAIIEKSGVAESAFKTVYAWLGFLPGGLAAGLIVLATLFAAMTGVSSASTVALGLTALPPMLRLKYDAKLSMGCIQAGGAIGVLIPPSITFVIIGIVGQLSVGRLFASGMGPGLVLSSVIIAYVLIRCRLNPKLGPTLPKQDRVALKERVFALKGLVPLLILIGLVLTPIFAGITTITEAAAIGALGSLVVAFLKHRLSRGVLESSLEQTMLLSAMIMWIIIGASVFAGIFAGSGINKFINDLVLNSGLSPYAVLSLMMLILFIMGTFVETTGIIMITIPIFLPLIKALGFDPIWFGALFVVNMEMGLLTPPFGYNLFYMKGVVDCLKSNVPETRDIEMTTIMRAVWPFVLCQAIALVIVIMAPQIALWLPDLLFGGK